MASIYRSKTVKIIMEYRTEGVYARNDYFVEYRGKILNLIPFDSQKEAEKYIYKRKLIRSKRTMIPVIMKNYPKLH